MCIVYVRHYFNSAAFPKHMNSIRDTRLYYKLLINMNPRLFLQLVLFILPWLFRVSSQHTIVFTWEHSMFIIYIKENREVIDSRRVASRTETVKGFSFFCLVVFNIKPFRKFGSHNRIFNTFDLNILWKIIFSFSIYTKLKAVSYVPIACNLSKLFCSFFTWNSKGILWSKTIPRLFGYGNFESKL